MGNHLGVPHLAISRNATMLDIQGIVYARGRGGLVGLREAACDASRRRAFGRILVSFVLYCWEEVPTFWEELTEVSPSITC